MTTTRPPKTTAQRLTALVRKLRKSRDYFKEQGITDKHDLSRSIAKKNKFDLREHHDLIELSFIEANAMSDRKAAHRGIEVLTGNFQLSEVFEIVCHRPMPDDPDKQEQYTLVLERAELTVPTGDKLLQQKRSNRRRIVRAEKLWEWEWVRVIRPVLVAHPDWNYRDAYEHILRADGRMPDPPDLVLVEDE